VELCGHSYGGCVVTGVADRISDSMDELFYLDALVPENGQSLHDFLPPERETLNSKVCNKLETVGGCLRFPPFYERAVKGWKTLTWSCGHDVMLDLPEELTQELLAGSPRRALSAL
jgi:pimeloyl-ACP methyl ester carboxylesterase